MRADGGRTDIPKLFTLLGADRSGTIELNEFKNGVERLSDEYNQDFDQYDIRKPFNADANKATTAKNLMTGAACRGRVSRD